jgi:prepilin-type N-terminal cleavage/methylation domain-containing protein
MLELWRICYKSGSCQVRPAVGFTLVELLVVIAVIGLLSTISILAMNNSRHQAKVARVKADMNQFMKAVAIAQGESNKALMQITGSGCSICHGLCGGIYGGSRDLRNVPESDTCYVRWITDLNQIEAAAGGIAVGVNKITRDPWGSPYLLDENECEGGGGYSDTIRTAGPDGVYPSGDDIWFYVPKLNLCP